jgi:hypothetical protein
MSKINASKLRQDIYRILDNLLETGSSLEIERKGRIIRLVPDKKKMDPKTSKLSKLKKHKLTNEPSEFFTHIDWTKEWKGLKK